MLPDFKTPKQITLDDILGINGLEKASLDAIIDPTVSVCMNSSGLVNNLNCSEPFCNCSEDAKQMMPTEPEPFDDELVRLKKETDECALIQQKLGDSWLGCNLGDPKDPSNCKCPKSGDNYWKYLAYTQTNATFWKTDPKTPLLRRAQMILLGYQRIIITVHGNKDTRPGDLIEIDVRNDENAVVKRKRFNGKWMVYKTERLIKHNRCSMNLYLMRDSNYLEPVKIGGLIKLSKEKTSNA
jgi:hypothetical protein